MFTNDYSLTKLFVTKEINIETDKKEKITIAVPTIKDLIENSDLSRFLQLSTMPISDLNEKFGATLSSNLELIHLILFSLGMFGEYRIFYNSISNSLPKIFKNLTIDLEEKEIKTDGITITSELFDYVIFIVRQACGEKVEETPTFNSEEERQLYLAQQEAEKKIKRIKASAIEHDSEGLLKVLLAIVYSFPSFSIDYLFNQTMAQIHWLQGFAAGAVSYEVNAKIFAAGNMKSGQSLKFFIK